MATMKDIAKRAGVSTSTVSHVINQSRFVSEEIALKVKKAATELNYFPSALARSLKLNRTQTIGLILTTSNNPFFGEVVKGVERRCYQKNYNLILCNTEGDKERMKTAVLTLLERRVDGLILLCSTFDGQDLEAFEYYTDAPKVIMDWGEVPYPCDRINDNSEQGGFLAAQHLIHCGHKEIACITGPLNRNQAKSRYAGFQRAMMASRIPIKEEWVIESNFECEGGYESLNALIKRCDKNNVSLPTAIFVCNDMMAMGVINGAVEKGIRIPDELSIIGYDDISIAKFMTPPLTTIHQPKYRLGQAAVDTLLLRIEDRSIESKQVQLEPDLIVRNSVKAL